MQNAKRALLRSSQALGMFHLARLLGNHGLNILCYHGFELEDEAVFRPELFIRNDTFANRMETLARRRVPVLRLDEALRRLRDRTLPRGATVITIDDGFYSVLRIGAPILTQHGFPATLYVTSYYVTKETPIFRLEIQYMFWRAEQRRLRSIPPEQELAWTGQVADPAHDLAIAVERERLMWRIIQHGERDGGENERENIARQVGEWLGVDHDRIRCSRKLSLLSPNELKVLEGMGIDVQLHTHRHRFPQDSAEEATAEIAENKRVLEKILGHTLSHFCYPDGSWASHQWPWLSAAGVKSATTCLPGLNHQDTPLFALRRYLDCERLTATEFEAEMSGYAKFLRAVSRYANTLLNGSHWAGA